MPDPSISVAIATYNGAKYLEEQLNSILSQTLIPSEIVVTDDGSTDGTKDILERYQKSGLIRYSVNADTLGYIANFKRAVSMCKKGNHVALSDQDDVWLPGKLQAAADVLKSIEDQNRPLMVYSDLILVDPSLNVLNSSFRNELGQDSYEHCLETVLFGGFVNGCTMLMNPAMVTLFDTIPSNADVPHDSWISLIAHTFGVVREVPEALILYRKHSENATGLESHRKKGRWGRLKEETMRSFRNNDLFEREIRIAQLFYNEFGGRLTIEQNRLFRKFLGLKGKSYLRKKLALRLFFRGKWLIR